MSYICNCKSFFPTHQERSKRMATCPVVTLPAEVTRLESEAARLAQEVKRYKKALEKCRSALITGSGLEPLPGLEPKKFSEALAEIQAILDATK